MNSKRQKSPKVRVFLPEGSLVLGAVNLRDPDDADEEFARRTAISDAIIEIGLQQRVAAKSLSKRRVRRIRGKRRAEIAVRIGRGLTDLADSRAVQDDEAREELL